MKSLRSYPPVIVLAAGLVAGVAAGQAQESPGATDSGDEANADLQRCEGILDDEQRLACFDSLAQGDEPSAQTTHLERHWDLLGESRLFQPWAHRPTYMLPARWTDQVNEAPFVEAAAGSSQPSPELQSVEAKFQISFKTKLWDGLFGGPTDLWFGYTQQSHFQVYNSAESRPFRETDFEPEVIFVAPARTKWGRFTWRMVGAGLVHQSNGRSEPLSRSWNRVYGVVAGERGNLTLQLRAWARVDSTHPDVDDNPDIEEFIGRSELLVNWSPGRQVLVFRGRSNLELDRHRGSFQVDWFFPLRDRLRGQLQVFTGYGESLIDYDHRQTTIGVGVLLFDPF
jgi:phospholipase A1